MADWKVKKPQMSFFRKFGGQPLQGCYDLTGAAPLITLAER
jgi:hypothetical protein